MNQRQQRHPFAGEMYRGGAPIAPSRGSGVGGIDPALVPIRAPGGGLAPGWAPQLATEAMMFRPEVAPDRIIRVPNLASIGPGAIGNPVGIQWPDDGYVLALSTCARGDGSNAGQASLAVQIQAGDQGTYITGNGQTGDYVLFWSVSPVPGCTNLLYRAVARQETWTITCRNYHAANTYTPEVTFYFKTLRTC